MKIYKAVIICLVLLMLSMGVACADDLNQTVQNSPDIGDGDVVSAAGDNTYTDLETDIAKSTGSIELGHNYTYDNQIDKNKTFLNFNNEKYTIEGNNSYIDGNGQAGFLKIVNKSDITIQNLLIRNCNLSAIILSDSKLTLINVTFESNFDKDSGAAIYTVDASLTITKSKFLNNYAPEGASIYAYNGDVNINDTLFKSDKAIDWSMVKGNKAIINIYNSTFADIVSKYATAVHNNFITAIRKSKFINLYANATAGAVAVKGGSNITYTVILDCEFINVTSAKNAGALFLDIYGSNNGKLLGDVRINNTIFIDCASEFGGAILQLGGFAQIENSQFINNTAKYNGGAIYTSYVDLKVDNCNFTHNNADEFNGCGGAVFTDINSTVISNSNFKNNTAKEGGAVYTYDCYYNITNTKFENNGEDIHTYFDNPKSAIINSGNVNKTLNDTRYVFDVRYGANPIIINRTKINASTSDSYFNLRDLGLVTPVRDQGYMGSCWAFGAAGAFESAFLIATGITLDISENNIQNLGLMYSIFGNPYLSEAGTYLTSTGYFLSWLGAINTPDDTYDELGKISQLSFSPDAYHIVDSVFINVSDRNAIKEALTKYGALNLFVYGANANDPNYYSKGNSSVYYYGNGTGNHYVTLVGWNDTFSKDNFVKQAPGDGAWICKNSWGCDWGDGGYYYLSYYDKSLIDSDAVGFVIENTEHYEKLYQIEVGGLDNYNTQLNEYEDVFVSEDGDIIAAVGTYFEKANTPYTISIYLDGNLAYTQNGVSKRSGYNTIKLDEYVAVQDKSVFSVRIKSSSTPILSSTRQKLLTNNSFVVINGERLFLKDSVAPIKVYTYHSSLITENIIKYLDGNNTIFQITGVDGESVEISYNGTNSTIVLNGTYNLSLGVLKVGNYPITLKYRNMTFTNYVIVKSTIDTDGVTDVTISYNTEATIGVLFLDLNGKGLNKTKVNVKYDGENVVFETDENGLVNIVIYQGNDIGTHYLDLVNPVNGESLRMTINIVSRFVGNTNIDMYYFDGHTYQVRVRDNMGDFVGAGKIVTIKIGKKVFKVKTDANGYATLKIPNSITPGKYTITAEYAGQTVKNTLNVKQVLKLKKAKVKRSAKKLVLKATLKQGSKALKSKKVTFKFNGKKYSAKTNKKGVAKVTIKKNVIKKLKKGKYVSQATYLKDTVKSTVRVR